MILPRIGFVRYDFARLFEDLYYILNAFKFETAISTDLNLNKGIDEILIPFL